jgi:hypothetical protein
MPPSSRKSILQAFSLQWDASIVIDSQAESLPVASLFHPSPVIAAHELRAFCELNRLATRLSWYHVPAPNEPESVFVDCSVFVSGTGTSPEPEDADEESDVLVSGSVFKELEDSSGGNTVGFVIFFQLNFLISG